MFRPALYLVPFVLIQLHAGLSVADPSDLLQQAIEEEKEPAQKPAAKKLDKLISEADRLLEQKQFNKAIKLYQKAYRLAPANQNNYVRLLVAKRAAGVMTEQDRQALEIIEQGRIAEMDQAFRIVRLKIIQARGALRSGDRALARALAESAMGILDRLPDSVDDMPYRRQLMALYRVIRKKPSKSKSRKPQPAGGVAAVDGSTIVVTRPVGNAAADDQPTLMDAGEQAVGASSRRTETGEIINVDDVLSRSHERHVYDRELTQALRRDRARTFVKQNETMLPPLADMTFPEDWAEKTARRSKYRGGLIHKGKPFTGKDGKTYYTAIYDLGDLVHPVPNFYATYPGSVREQRFQREDRFYLQYRSQIFNGYADDLAAGLPLLHYFGGIDENALSTRTDPQETERILRILDQFVEGQ